MEAEERFKPYRMVEKSSSLLETKLVCVYTRDRREGRVLPKAVESLLSQSSRN
jgi:hypothetical protein